MNSIAVFPGSFDPVTIAHHDLVMRASPLFVKIIIAIGQNSTKKNLFALDHRLGWLQQTFASIPNVETATYEGMTVDFCKKAGATHLLRGLRQTGDFEFEKTIAQLNHSLTGIETIFLVTRPEYSHVSSTIVREILSNGGDARAFLPAVVAEEVHVQ